MNDDRIEPHKQQQQQAPCVPTKKLPDAPPQDQPQDGSQQPDTPDNEDSLIGNIVHGNLLIRTRLGEGTSGRVYLAENAKVHERRYAVKVLRRSLTPDPSFAARFYEEARNQAQLDHPNNVSMTDYFQVGDDYFLVQDYVDGHPLDEVMDAQSGKLSEKRALAIMKDVLNGLNAAHMKTIVHRDVKPSNILIDRTGRARVTDFGIASQRGGTASMAAGAVYGTPAYMSPEQLAGSDDVNHQSDVFSAGVVLFEMLTGKLPYGGDTFQAVMEQQRAHGAANPRMLDDKIRRPVANIVCDALQPDRATRLPGCLSMVRAIERVQRGNRWRIGALVVVVSGLLAWGVASYVSRVRDRTAIAGSVVSAVNNYSLLCREAPRLALKQQGEQYARDTGNSLYADQFAQQIREIDDNMNRDAQTYANELKALNTYHRAQVTEVLAESDSDPQHDHFREQLRADYTRPAGSAPPTRAEMLQHCPPG